jgi:uncharacterized membrane protein required for colicin V production
MNWIDLLFAAMTAFLLIKGYLQGLKRAFSQLLGAIGASALTIFLSNPLIQILQPSFPTIGDWIRPLITTAILIFLWFVFHIIADSMHKITRDDFVEVYERVGGFGMGILKSFVFGTICMTVVHTFPNEEWVSSAKDSSRLYGSFIAKQIPEKLGFGSIPSAEEPSVDPRK